uniref:Uncharacterized protein n=1 Tax=Vespula pensylvanica TaxID=30213 RepID=A0A834NLU0_VESPE|nr:hypothetical protein H0235_012684 [Vespula pensylvanica]
MVVVVVVVGGGGGDGSSSDGSNVDGDGSVVVVTLETVVACRWCKGRNTPKEARGKREECEPKAREKLVKGRAVKQTLIIPGHSTTTGHSRRAFTTLCYDFKYQASEWEKNY